MTTYAPHIIIDELPPKAAKGDRAAIDTEWFGMDKNRLHRPHGTFACLTITTDGKTVYVITDPEKIKPALKQINAAIWIFQNAKFDVIQLRTMADLKPRTEWIDIMLIEQTMFGGLYDSAALNDMARRYLDYYMEKETRSEFSAATKMTREMIRYAAIDTIVTWHIYWKQKEIIDEESLNAWRTVEKPFFWSLVSMSGFMLDVPAWEALADKNEIEVEKRKRKFAPLLPTSNQQVKAHLKKLGYNLPDVQKDTLEEIAGECKFAKDILEYREYQTNVSRYGRGFLRHVEADGRVYSDFYQMGAECLPADQLVLTNRGYLSICNVKIGDCVITHAGNIKPVTHKTNNGIKKIVEIVLANGLSLRSTHNHPYMTTCDKKWKPANEIRVGDELVVYASEEEWKPIAEWEDYKISSWGRVLNVKTGHILAQHINDRWGHLTVCLVRNGSQRRGDDRKDFRVHRLVAQAFVKNDDPDTNVEVRHVNGIAWDNSKENLMWGTRMDNILDAIEHGSMSHLHSKQAKLSLEDVNTIRDIPYQRGGDGKVAQRFGVSRETVRDIRIGKRHPKGYFEGKKKEVLFGSSEVVSVNFEDEPEMTYGLEIQDDHSHVTAGIVTHNTGRMSSSKPNLQNVKKDKAYRSCFIAGQDNCLVIGDFSSQEPRILAHLSDDKNLIKIFKSGRDPYIETYKAMFHETITDKHDPRRDMIKTIFLGLDYGMSAFGLALRLGISEEEADQLIQDFFTTFPGVRDYITIKQRTRTDYVKTITGRKVWLNKHSDQWTRNALNGPIQGSAAEMTKATCAEFTANWGFDWNSPLVNIIHDEIVLEVPKVMKQLAIQTLEAAALKTAHNFHPEIPGKIDIVAGPNWGEK